MVLKSSDDFSSEITAIKEINSAISDLLSSKENFYKIVRELIVEYYNPVRKRFQDIDTDHRARKFLKDCLEYEQNGCSGEEPKSFFNSSSVSGLISYGNFYSEEINKLYNFNIVFDCNLSKIKLRQTGEFDGFNDFYISSFIASGNNLSLGSKNSGSYVIEYLACEDYELEEKIDLLTNSLSFPNFKNKISKSFEKIYFKEYKNKRFNYYLDQYFGGVPLLFYSDEYRNKVFNKIEYLFSNHLIKTLSTSTNHKEECDFVGILKSLFSGDEPYDNFLSENIAAKHFLSKFEGFGYLKPSKDEVVDYCKQIFYNNDEVKMFSDFDKEPLAKYFVYLFKSECLVIDDVVDKKDIQKFIEIMIFQKSYQYFGDPGKMIDYGLKKLSSKNVLDETRERIVDSSSSLLFLFKHKEDIQNILNLNKHKNSMFQSPIFFISPGEEKGFANLSLNIFEISNKFKDLLLFLKHQGIVETPQINIYLKDHEERPSTNVNYDINKSLSVIKKILNYDFDCEIEIFSTESLYSTYISDIFTEDELEKMSVSVFSDNEFEYPKDREVSDFSVKKLLYLNSHELSWISEILK